MQARLRAARREVRLAPENHRRAGSRSRSRITRSEVWDRRTMIRLVKLVIISPSAPWRRWVTGSSCLAATRARANVVGTSSVTSAHRTRAQNVGRSEAVHGSDGVRVATRAAASRSGRIEWSPSCGCRRWRRCLGGVSTVVVFVGRRWSFDEEPSAQPATAITTTAAPAARKRRITVLTPSLPARTRPRSRRRAGCGHARSGRRSHAQIGRSNRRIACPFRYRR